MNKLTISILLFAAAATVAHADNYVLQANATPQKARWSADDGATTLATSEVPEGSVFQVLNALNLQTSGDYAMPRTVEIGNADSQGRISCTASGVLSGTFDWNWGRIWNTTANTRLTIDGTLNVLAVSNHIIECYTDSSDIDIAADLKSEDTSAVIQIGVDSVTRSPMTYEEMNAGCPSGQIVLSGDNSGYKGRFILPSKQTYFGCVLVLAGNYPLGSPDTEAGTVLSTLYKPTVLIAVSNDCAQSGNRRIYIDTGYLYLGAWKNTDYDGRTLSYAIQGNTKNKQNRGNVCKVGDGTLRYNGTFSFNPDDSQRDIAISNGTFIVGADASFPSKYRFVVGSGALLAVEPSENYTLTAAKLTLVDETATAEYATVTVPFDGTTSTPVEMTALMRKYDSYVALGKGSWTHPFKLAQPIALPIRATTRFPVFTIPGGGMTVDKFRDETPKSSDLLTTRLVLVDGENSQTLYVEADPVLVTETVPFDGTNATALTLADWPAGVVQPFALSQPFDLPIVATNRQAVLKIPGGTHTLADFRDETPKTVCGLPTTWLELGTDNAGNQVLYVVAKPTLAAVGQKMSEASSWSDGKSTHAGADYYYVNRDECYTGYDQRTTGGSWSDGTLSFAGDSYTLADGKTLRAYTAGLEFKSLRTFPDATIIPNWGGSSGSASRTQTWRGGWFVGGDADDWETPVVLSPGNYIANLVIESALSGAGSLKLASSASTLAEEDDRVRLRLYGDNRNFSGQLRFSESADAKSFVEVVATNGLAFGGALAARANDAVKIFAGSSKVTEHVRRMVISAAASLTVDAANRGWTTTCGCGFRAAAGATFTFAPPVFCLGGEIRKDGAGTLALGYDELVAASAAKLTVAEGSVSQLKAGCLDGVAVEFAGGGVCVDANAAEGAKASGFAPASIALADGVASVPVTFANVTRQSPATFSQTVLTAPAGAPALNLVTVRSCGYGVTITSVPGEDGTTVYTANLKRSGLCISFR